MLTTYLNNQPYSKFVLIEDSLVQPGEALLQYIISSHIKASNCRIHYCVFEGNFQHKRRGLAYPNVQCYDLVSDSKAWINPDRKQDFSTIISDINNKNGGVVVIDSLSHAIFQAGIATVYRIIQQLLAESNVSRIVTILHQDVCEDIVQTSRYFQHIATLALILEPKFNSNNGRVSYVYRKPGGKVIKKIEEYYFANGILKTEPIKVVDSKVIVRENLTPVQPENLTTFKIGLNDKDKASRDKLILPYLPKDSIKDEQEEAKIFYQFDNVDDWDEEDPDDDLDI